MCRTALKVIILSAWHFRQIDPAGVYIFAWHRYDVIAWSDIGGVTWLQLDNNYWIPSDVVLELRFEDNEWQSEPDLTEIQSNLPEIP